MNNQRTKRDLSHVTELEKAAMERVIVAIRNIIGTQRVQFEDHEAAAILESTHPRYSAAVSFSSNGDTFAAFTTRLGTYTFEGKGALMAGGVPRLSVLSCPRIDQRSSTLDAAPSSTLAFNTKSNERNRS